MAFRELEYQDRTLRTLDDYLTSLAHEKGEFDKVVEIKKSYPGVDIPLPDYPAKAWAQLAIDGRLPLSRAHVAFSPRYAGDGQPVPNATLKVPTGGGKTFLACASLSRIFGRYLAKNTGFVLWIVPNEAIYTQTLRHLRDRQHAYRETLDRAAAGRVIIMEKGDPLNRADVDANLCIMVLMLQSSNRQNQATLKLFQDSGAVHGFTPPEGAQEAHKALLAAIPNLDAYDLGDGGPGWPMIKDSVGNALRIIRPIIIMDEGQRAVADLAFSTLYGFNPLFVLELSATPKDVAARPATVTRPARPGRSANILVEITGRELEREGMIKMPLEIMPTDGTDWRATVRKSLEKLDQLATAAEAHEADGGHYIRPILLVQAERTGADQRDAGYIHADDARDFLMKCGLEADEIALKTADTNDLEKPENRDLMANTCRVRAIVTKAALAEGWDCPFAYVLCTLAASGNESAMTQLVGRILRQPNAEKTKIDALDQCYVFTHRAETRAVVDVIKRGLNDEGLGDLARDVVVSDPVANLVEKRKIERRVEFRTADIALPTVLWHEAGHPARPIDPETDLFPLIDWTACDVLALANGLSADAGGAASQVVRISTGKNSDFVTEATANVESERKFDGAYAVRMIGDIVPNPFVARDLIGRVLARLNERGFEPALIGRLAGFIIDEMRKALSHWRDGQASALFRELLDAGKIRFQLRGDGGDWIAPQYLWTTAQEGAEQLTANSGGALARSLYLPIYKADLNPDERSVAVYLDDEAAIRWWHRNGTDRNSYSLRGWRRGNVFPDFVFAALHDGGNERVVAMEAKGDQLAGNLDTEYKRQLLATLTEAFGKGIDGGAGGGTGGLGTGRAKIDFEAAVVLFSDWKAELPILIRGGVADGGGANDGAAS